MAVNIITKDKFYLYYPWFLFIFVMLAFPAKAIFTPELLPPIGPIHHIHALSMGAWFAMLVLQPTLIQNSRNDLHKLFGKLSVLLVVIFLVVSLVISKMNWDRTQEAMIVTANAINLVLFTGFYSSAIYFRHQIETHKRLMIFATVSIMGPAVGRIPEILDKPPESIAPLFLILPLAPLVNDLIKTRRAHPATIVGVILLVSTIPLILYLSSSADWHGFLVDVLG